MYFIHGPRQFFTGCGPSKPRDWTAMVKACAILSVPRESLRGFKCLLREDKRRCIDYLASLHRLGVLGGNPNSWYTHKHCPAMYHLSLHVER